MNMKSLNIKLGIILALVFALFALSASSLSAQETILAPGASITIRADTIPIVHDTMFVDVPGPERCPDGWICTPPPSQLYVVTVSDTRNDASGTLTAPEGMLFVNLERRDGAWFDTAEGAAIPGVDSVVFVLDGVRNRERLYPYEVGGGPIPLAVGIHELTWEVFGVDPDSGTATLTVTVTVSFRIPEPIPMKDGLMVQAVFPLDDIRPLGEYVAMLVGGPGNPLPDDLGWYWLPAPPTGTITIDGPESTWSGSYD